MFCDGQRVGRIKAGEHPPKSVGVGVVIQLARELVHLRHKGSCRLLGRGNKTRVARELFA